MPIRLVIGKFKQRLCTLFIQEMTKRGCHGYTLFFLTAIRGDNELEQTCAAAQEMCATLAAALETGNVDRLLECKPKQDSFHCLIRWAVSWQEELLVAFALPYPSPSRLG